MNNKKKGIKLRLGKRRGMSTHHRKPRSIGGGNNIGNLSVVTLTKHEAWHTLFENKCAEEIAEIINSIWLDPDYCLMVINLKNIRHEKH